MSNLSDAIDSLREAIQILGDTCNPDLRLRVTNLCEASKIQLEKSGVEHQRSTGSGGGTSSGPKKKAVSEEEIELTNKMLDKLSSMDIQASEFIDSLATGFDKYGSLTIGQYNALKKVYAKEVG